jgi:ATP-dependent nuclease, subunit B
MKSQKNVFYYWDREEEIEHIVRQILALHHDGKPLSSIGIAMANPADYLDLTRSLFEEYRIPYRVCAKQPLKETKTFELVFTLMDLIEQNFRAGDVQNLFNSPLVSYRSATDGKLNREKFNKLDLTHVIGGLDDFDLKMKNHIDYLKNSEKFNELYVKSIEEYSRILLECLNRIKSKLDLNSGVEELSKAMFELISDFSLSNHIFKGLEHKETHEPVYREAIAYRELVSTLKDVHWVSRFVKMSGEDFFKVVRSLLLSLNHEDRYYGDCVSMVVDKDCFWLDFEHLFYCGLGLQTLFPSTNPLLTNEESAELGILERKRWLR